MFRSRNEDTSVACEYSWLRRSLDRGQAISWNVTLTSILSLREGEEEWIITLTTILSLSEGEEEWIVTLTSILSLCEGEEEWRDVFLL